MDGAGMSSGEQSSGGCVAAACGPQPRELVAAAVGTACRRAGVKSGCSSGNPSPLTSLAPLACRPAWGMVAGTWTWWSVLVGAAAAGWLLLVLPMANEPTDPGQRQQQGGGAHGAGGGAAGGSTRHLRNEVPKGAPEAVARILQVRRALGLGCLAPFACSCKHWAGPLGTGAGHHQPAARGNGRGALAASPPSRHRAFFLRCAPAPFASSCIPLAAVFTSNCRRRATITRCWEWRRMRTRRRSGAPSAPCRWPPTQTRSAAARRAPTRLSTL